MSDPVLVGICRLLDREFARIDKALRHMTTLGAAMQKLAERQEKLESLHGIDLESDRNSNEFTKLAGGND
jgi:hypothetical protein